MQCVYMRFYVCVCGRLFQNIDWNKIRIGYWMTTIYIQVLIILSVVLVCMFNYSHIVEISWYNCLNEEKFSSSSIELRFQSNYLYLYRCFKLQNINKRNFFSLDCLNYYSKRVLQQQQQWVAWSCWINLICPILFFFLLRLFSSIANF